MVYKNIKKVTIKLKNRRQTRNNFETNLMNKPYS